MRLFLDAPEAFDEVWSLHLLYAAGSPATVLTVPGPPLVFGDAEIRAVAMDLKDWFHGLAKGSECFVRAFAREQEHVFLITRGSYLRTVAQWDGSQIAFHKFRPASEDVILYNAATQELTIRAALRKDRDHYILAFARCLASNDALALHMRNAPALTLAPLQDDSFSYTGDGVITRVALIGATLVLPLPGNPVITVRADDVVETVHDHLPCLALSAGTLRSARLRFTMAQAGEPDLQVTVEIEPPDRTNLAQKKSADIIERYLIEQGVKRG